MSADFLVWHALLGHRRRPRCVASRAERELVHTLWIVHAIPRDRLAAALEERGIPVERAARLATSDLVAPDRALAGGRRLVGVAGALTLIIVLIAGALAAERALEPASTVMLALCVALAAWMFRSGWADVSEARRLAALEAGSID